MSGQSIRGKTALVTGGARRLGRAIALGLAAEGVNVVVHYGESVADANEVCREVRQLGVQAWAVQANLGVRAEYESLLKRAQNAAGPIEILVNNASIYPSGRLKDVTLDDVMSNVEINAWAPFTLCRSFAEHAGRGKIVNMLDAKLMGYDWTHTAYFLSKHMLAVLTRMMALAFAPDITVNAVSPGLILPPEGKDQSFMDKLVDSVPLKRHGMPEDIAEAVVYLVKSDFLTGQVIFVDGGRHLTPGPRL